MTPKFVHIPWAQPEFEVPDIAALKALQRGDAEPEQQRRALAWIIEQAAGTYEMTFHPEGDRASAFAEGKRHVGRSIVGFLKMPMDTVKRMAGGS